MRIYYDNDFKKMSKDEIKRWVMLYKNQLVGSAIFTKNNSFISKIVSWVCRGLCNDASFIPSHVGSLIESGGTCCVFDMKPPKATLTKLEDYLCNTKDEYLIVVRDFGLDTELFSLNICKRINQKYGYISAIQSAFKYLWYPLREHCSEIHLKELQGQKLFVGKDANETTPDELMHLLTGRLK